ncbi:MULTISPECIES: hypothetical protein [unclassified Nostoc]|uniref:hypothetical protein n=1 Tax=unclassified Nostoc TaxID=2593658 RepID=UPI0025D8080F|nr:hypothetical protein [Nostoc sp. JL23]
MVLVAVLSGLYRHSQRMVQSAMQDIFGISMSLGTVNKLRLEASSPPLRKLCQQLLDYYHLCRVIILTLLQVLETRILPRIGRQFEFLHTFRSHI